MKNQKKIKAGDPLSDWEKQKEWYGNTKLGFESYKKEFQNPHTGRMVPVFVFGKLGEIGSFCVSAGANSEFSYSGFVPGSETLKDVMIYVNFISSCRKLFK